LFDERALGINRNDRRTIPRDEPVAVSLSSDKSGRRPVQRAGTQNWTNSEAWRPGVARPRRTNAKVDPLPTIGAHPSVRLDARRVRIARYHFKKPRESQPFAVFDFIEGFYKWRVAKTWPLLLDAQARTPIKTRGVRRLDRNDAGNLANKSIGFRHVIDDVIRCPINLYRRRPIRDCNADVPVRRAVPLAIKLGKLCERGRWALDHVHICALSIRVFFLALCPSVKVKSVFLIMTNLPETRLKVATTDSGSSP
jgi:hypothetical protein